MKKGSQRPETVNLLTSDEWDHVRYLIEQDLNCLATIDITKDSELSNHLFHSNILFLFEREIKEQLIKAGFEKKVIENQEKLKQVVKTLDKQGLIIHGYWDENLLYGLPTTVLTFSEDRKTFWVNPEIESALRAFESINSMKKELFNNEAIGIFLKAFELLVNVFRAGCMNPILSEMKKQENRGKTMEIYENHISAAIERVFRKYPKYKTLDQLWRHFNSVNAEGVFTNPKSKNKKKDMYKLKIETDSQTKKEVLNIYIYILDSENELQLKLLKPIKKRSLQKYIDKYKATSKITQ